MKHKLQHGHATRCATPEDQIAIVAICHASNVPVYPETLKRRKIDGYPHLVWDGVDVTAISERHTPVIWISNAEFVARALGHEPKPIEPPIIIDGRTLDFLPGGSVKVGCQTIAPETIDLIQQRSKAQRP
jgi:hypothetical protein